jgi:hypothetical protein
MANAPTKTAHRAARARAEAMLIAPAALGATGTEVLAAALLLGDPDPAGVVVAMITVVREEELPPLPPEGEEEPEPGADDEVDVDVYGKK